MTSLYLYKVFFFILTLKSQDFGLHVGLVDRLHFVLDVSTFQLACVFNHVFSMQVRK